MDGNLSVLNAYIQQEENYWERKKVIVRELERRQEVALKKLLTAVSPIYVEQFAKLLLDATSVDSEAADILIHDLDLSKSDLRALDGDETDIWDELLHEYEVEKFFYPEESYA